MGVDSAAQLVPLRTKDEVRASIETHVLYAVEIPARFANSVKDVIHEARPEFKPGEISHLRRVVQFKFLPPQLQKRFNPPARLQRGIRNSEEHEDDEQPPPAALFNPLPPSDDESCSDSDEESCAKSEDTVRFFLLCPTRCFKPAELVALLRKNPPFSTMNIHPKLLYVTVPALAPTSAEQANQWSEQYWPIAYKNTNPFGPHPSLVARNTAEIESEAGDWLALARTAAAETAELGVGEEVGCVVVDRSSGTGEVVAIAGDCRWRSPIGEAESHTGPGNVMAHAVQRAIAIVAKKRLLMAGKNPAFLDRTLFCDIPLTAAETAAYEKANIEPTGYLCVNLDIYLTHEPCVMCSMAILHSRFRRCIFGKRMPLTGGMTSDTAGNDANPGKGLQHGIFWRPSELNWKFLAWESPASAELSASVTDTLHV
ncbi:cytidine deaminase-like protein [Bimuria novae-zelandiae CBS 107.79]|uniref:Cytidine deaminase-like protein n=1 Tax=Bimuria novae-zelandiae CBS 107.79 TaxID=1447943 RepID=A0A6A5VRI8_9PLEO|nr:cytidine deaminase-like protein [Bimuria novae-zelandiae CBS 107.79]